MRNIARRMKTHLSKRVESAVRANLGALVAEVKETTELAQLLVKASHEKLTPKERQKVQSQLLDICKTIPALALFAVPGGSLILPIALKLLPFNLMPSNFSETEEEID